jgi:hypothetical protein
VTRCFRTAALNKTAVSTQLDHPFFLVCCLHHSEACISVSTIPPVKHYTVHVMYVWSVRNPSRFAKAHPTQEKLHEMRCLLFGKFSPQAPVPCKRAPTIKPSSGTKASTTPCNIHSCHTKEVYLCAPSPPSGTFTCRPLSVRPPLLLDQYGIVGYCKQDQHRCATDDESPYP